MPSRPEPLRVALAQVNATVGDLAGNGEKVRRRIVEAREAGAALVVFPELVLTGYPPEDLLLKTSFLEAAAEELDRVAEEAHGIVALVGFPELADDVYNAAAVLAEGEVLDTYHKGWLPNYGVFDEQRYFQVGTTPAYVVVNGVRIGLTICEDIWEPGPPASTEVLDGAQVIVNLSASPYHAGKGRERERMLVQRARDNLAAVVFCNLVGGQDELVFDGHSVAIDQDGQVIARAHQFVEELLVCTLDPGAVGAARLRDTRHRAAVRRDRESSAWAALLAQVEVEANGAAAVVAAPVEALAGGGANGPGSDGGAPHEAGDGAPGEVAGNLATGSSPDAGGRRTGPVTPLLDPAAEVYAALVLGVRDYVEKNGFSRVVFGLSGGIDSALVAQIAVDALGSERVACAIMPSPYSSEGTRRDAAAIADNLGIEALELAIEEPMQAFDRLLAEPFAGREPDIAEENLQARIRGNLVMALSNKFGWLVLTTGNKSELSVGYATLYGDMAGGFAVLKDVFKGWVYRLVRWRNAQAGRDLVPASVLDRAPSAELRYEQRDEDSLPPYAVLDAILEGYVERDLDREQLVREGLDADDVAQVTRLVDLAEYKRRQAPPGVRISTKAFGRDRRLPITNHFGRR